MNFNEQQYTKEQATHLLDNDLTDKDFWVVDTYDNIHILQSVLDVLFNCNYPDSRIYLGDYLPSQNSMRLIIKCQVCSKDLSSYDPFMGHDKGKQHKKAIKQTFTQDLISPNISGPIIFKSQDSLGNNFEPESLEYLLSQTNHPVLGYQFIYREIYQDKENFFSCQLCNARRLRKEEAFKHITNDNHILKFLNIKYGLQHTTFEEAYDVINKISVIEGRISALILTYHHSDIDRMFKIKPEIPPSLSQSEIEPFDGTQIDSLMGSTESFLTELCNLQIHFNNCDILTLKLKDDKKAMQLETDLIQIVAEKLLKYSKMDSDYQAHAEKLCKKTKELALSLD